MTDENRPLVSGLIVSTSEGYAMVDLGLTEKPPDSVQAVLGYFVIDNGPPTYVVIEPGDVEQFIVPGLSSGKHDGTIGTIYVLRDGRSKWIDARGNCFIMKSRYDL